MKFAPRLAMTGKQSHVKHPRHVDHPGQLAILDKAALIDHLKGFLNLKLEATTAGMKSRYVFFLLPDEFQDTYLKQLCCLRLWILV